MPKTSDRQTSRVALAILNWNGLGYLQQFIPPLLERTQDADIWVIDNASKDQSLDWLRKNHPSVKCLELDKNYGFAGGYNLGLEQIDAEYFVLLNSDVEVSENWLLPLVNWMDENPELAACQPTIRDYNFPERFEHAGAAGGYLDRYGFPFCAGRIFNTFEDDKEQYGDRAEVFWATGACLMVRANLYKELGGLDEHFFAHMEEIDLCWRLKNQGYAIGAVRSSKVFHVGGGTLQKSNPFKTFLNFRNNLALLVKNDRSTMFWLKLYIRMVLDAVAFARFLSEGKFKDALAVIRAHFAFYGRFPRLLRKRKALKAKDSSINTNGRYHKSIVLAYYLRGKRYFSDLEF